jgi:hypothetical protein
LLTCLSRCATLALLRVLQEACRNDRASLTLLQRLRRLVRLAFGLSLAGSSSSSEPYPCTLAGELLDGTRQAAAAITGGSSRDAAAGSRGGSGGRVRAGAGVDSVAAAKGAAGASTLDPDSPGEHAAAAQQSAWLFCGSLSQRRLCSTRSCRAPCCHFHSSLTSCLSSLHCHVPAALLP